MRPRPANPTLRRAAMVAVAVCSGLATTRAQGIGGGLPMEDGATLIDQKLGARVATDATFADETGAAVTVADYLRRGKPLILNPQYFGCPSLCGEGLRDLLAKMKSIELELGRDFEVLSVSFDHREKPAMAASKKAAYVEAYGRPDAAAGWHFLTGTEDEIRKLTASVGYGFRWNQTRNDFDHRAALIFVSPSGGITRYLADFRYDAKTFRLAIVEASEGRVGSALDRFYLSCYGYDPRTGTYSRIGGVVMTLGGVLTLAALGSLLFVLWRRERRQAALATAS